MIMCLYLSYLTHFSGQGRNPCNNFVAFLENLRHHNFVLRLSDLQYSPMALYSFALLYLSKRNKKLIDLVKNSRQFQALWPGAMCVPSRSLVTTQSNNKSLNSYFQQCLSSCYHRVLRHTVKLRVLTRLVQRHMQAFLD